MTERRHHRAESSAPRKTVTIAPQSASLTQGDKSVSTESPYVQRPLMGSTVHPREQARGSDEEPRRAKKRYFIDNDAADGYERRCAQEGHVE